MKALPPSPKPTMQSEKGSATVSVALFGVSPVCV